MLITLEPANGDAVYDQVANAIAAQIVDGALPAGERLPAARDLAEVLGLNVHTVLHAYQRLRDDGLIELRRGRGAVVVGGAGSAALHAAVSEAVVQARASGLGLPTLIALIRKEHGS